MSVQRLSTYILPDAVKVGTAVFPLSGQGRTQSDSIQQSQRILRHRNMQKLANRMICTFKQFQERI